MWFLCGSYLINIAKISLRNRDFVSFLQKNNSKFKFSSNIIAKYIGNIHCMKSVGIRSFSGPYFPAFGLNTGRYGVFLRTQSECRKIGTRKTLNTDTFNLKKSSVYT